MERSTLARPYADAVAKLAGESNAWSAWSERLGLLALVAADEQIQIPGVQSRRPSGHG
jgi:F0F1-type ATP synthase delta subunit